MAIWARFGRAAAKVNGATADPASAAPNVSKPFLRVIRIGGSNQITGETQALSATFVKQPKVVAASVSEWISLHMIHSLTLVAT